MYKKLIIIASLFFCLVAQAQAPNFKAIKNSQERRQAFIKFMVPLAQKANQDVAAERKELLQTYNTWQLTNRVPAYHRAWLVDLADTYNLPKLKFKSKKDWDQLLKRVDVVPISMVLAQAANESAWGTSRFAIHGDNYFGQWCYKRGCGLVPRRRRHGATHEVRKFPDVEDSIESYIENINTNRAYTQLRQIRYQLRETHKPLTGIALVAGLKNYSERGMSYVNDLREMIKSSRLSRYDQS